MLKVKPDDFDASPLAKSTPKYDDCAVSSIEDPFENMVNGGYPPVRVMHQLQYLLIVIPPLKNESSYPTPVHLSPVCASTVSVTL